MRLMNNRVLLLASLLFLIGQVLAVSRAPIPDA